MIEAISSTAYLAVVFARTVWQVYHHDGDACAECDGMSDGWCRWKLRMSFIWPVEVLLYVLDRHDDVARWLADWLDGGDE